MSDHDEFFEELRDGLFFESSASLFEEAGDPPEERDGERSSVLARRLDTLEHRLERTLQCVNRCQTDQANLRKELRGLMWDRETDRKRLDRLQKDQRLGLWVALGAVLLGWVPQLAEGGQSVLNALASLLQMEQGLIAGGAMAGVLLLLGVRAGGWLVNRLSRRRERRDEDALSDR